MNTQNNQHKQTIPFPDEIIHLETINKKLDLNKEYPVNLNYCPKCRRKLKNKEKECPYCGIDIKDYLYNN